MCFASIKRRLIFTAELWQECSASCIQLKVFLQNTARTYLCKCINAHMYTYACICVCFSVCEKDIAACIYGLNVFGARKHVWKFSLYLFAQRNLRLAYKHTFLLWNWHPGLTQATAFVSWHCRKTVEGSIALQSLTSRGRPFQSGQARGHFCGCVKPFFGFRQIWACYIGIYLHYKHCIFVF